MTQGEAVVAGDTIPCADLDQLCSGAQALVHTAIRKDIVTHLPNQRIQDHFKLSFVCGGGGRYCRKGSMDTLILTHYVPAIPPKENEFHELVVQQWLDKAAEKFSGKVEIGDDLLKVTIK